MTRDQWKSLFSRDKVIWDSFPPQTKATLLDYRKPTSTPTPPAMKVNLHDMSAADYLCMLHTHPPIEEASDNNITPLDTSQSEFFDSSTDHDDTLVTNSTSYFTSEDSNRLGYVTKQTLPHGDPRRVLSSSTTEKSNPLVSGPKSSKPTMNKTPPLSVSVHTVVIDGKTYCQVSMHERTQYNISTHKASPQGYLVDRGEIGGLVGSDVRVIHLHANPRLVGLSGIDSHQIMDLPLLTVGGVVQSQRGNRIAIMHQYVYLGESKTIHSSGQLEWFENDVNDKSLKISGGLQRIQTHDGYVHPLDIKNDLPYVPMRPYTDKERETLPHVEWTGDADWDPTVLDHTITDKETWYDTDSDLEDLIIHSPFDEFGNFKGREMDLHFFVVGEIAHIDEEPSDIPPGIDDTIDNIAIFANEHERNSTPISSHATVVQHKSRDYESLRPFFLHQSIDVIKRTFQATTQFARTNIGSLQLKKTFKIPFPACNVHRRNEPVATDTVLLMYQPLMMDLQLPRFFQDVKAW